MLEMGLVSTQKSVEALEPALPNVVYRNPKNPFCSSHLSCCTKCYFKNICGLIHFRQNEHSITLPSCNFLVTNMPVF